MQSDTAPTTPPAPAAPALTIDTNRLRDLWLPSLRQEQASVEYMNKACVTAWGRPRYDHLNTARGAVTIQRNETVQHIRHRGGLLLIGGAQ